MTECEDTFSFRSPGLCVEGANRHDMKLVRTTIGSIVVECPEPTHEQPRGMCPDKGCDYQEVRDILAEFGFTAHIRSRTRRRRL